MRHGAIAARYSASLALMILHDGRKEICMKKKAGIAWGLVAVLVWVVGGSPAGAEENAALKAMVYKSPTCGCCSKWIDHLETNGFDVEFKNVTSVDPIKRMNGVPANLASCHTAIIGGYFIEGHVPAEDVKKLLQERPEVAGLAVPRMPIGSPGMEGPNPEPYVVLAVGKDGAIEVFARHEP